MIYGNILATENQQAIINYVIDVKIGVHLHKTLTNIVRATKDTPSSNSGHLGWKVRKIGTFQSFFLLREIVLRFIFEHFPCIPRKENLIEIPVELW